MTSILIFGMVSLRSFDPLLSHDLWGFGLGTIASIYTKDVL